MSEPILDDFTPAQQAPFAKKSFRQFLIAVGSYVIPFLMVAIFSLEQKQQEWFSLLLGASVLIGSSIAIIGFINGIKSIRRNEPSYKKYIGTIGNFFFVALLIVLLFINFVDLDQAFRE